MTSKTINQERLKNAALFYLGRYEATTARLREILSQKLRRWGADPNNANMQGWICNIITQCQQQGLVDDRRFGETRARVLLARGMGLSRIANDLRQRGLSREDIEAVLAVISDADQPLTAAMRFAERRKFGPYREGRNAARWREDRPRQRQREIAAMARAGHGLAIAQKIIDASSIEACEEI